MKKYKTPYILAGSKVYGFIPAAVAAVAGVTNTAAAVGSAVGPVAAGIGAIAALMKDDKFQTTVLSALEPVT